MSDLEASTVGAWRKSSYSGNEGHEGNCVEVAFTAEAVAVRDSKSPTFGALAVSPLAWTQLVRSAARPS
ncbi:DUF397 domain-containing protein [Amycolatopsis sp. H20-H5]|uniref:DUF397 domain-containing protein n=1 Tax=Amycolatopsis sp. H20-H5 TaxID=3046309 RepID=UPI002DBE28AC|nr:DUF397 domain-containing protein [Amycolatopsis sp. H20-H5]MEC3982177.1 DUF397 domain-containing protein [Amycolatopsis sp. H20-H5]